MEQLRAKLEQDHDKVIRIENDVSTICKTLIRIEKKIDDQRDEFNRKYMKDNDDCKDCKDDLIEKISDSTKESLSWLQFTFIFTPVIGVVFAGIFYLSGIALTNKNSVYSITDEVRDHNAYAAIAFEEMTGHKWGIIDRQRLDEARENYMRIRADDLKNRKVE